MSSIDERIVNMQFNNRQFESGIQTSLHSLDRLQKGLQLDGAAKSLSNLDRVGRSFSLDGISAGVESISNRFTALGIMGTTILQNLAATALNTGKRIASALTIDPIKTGFQEYETQINAVQTILANTSAKGTTLDQVNAALDQLNTYADKTIYNFTEMTRNIGTFTAAGVDLDTSVSAIKGIANLAAVSGSTSQQASTAMYQLSQAIASGTVKLMDWNSVVNAGMGGAVFQDALKETARAHGVAIDQMIKTEGSFRETLQKGWLTSEVLTETLSKFTGDLNAEQLKTMGYTNEQIESILKMGQTANDAATKVKTFTQLWDTLKEAAQSGWSQSWEIIVGDFEEAKLLLTEISDVLGGMIGASAAARIELLQGWKDLGGRASLIESARNAFQGLLALLAPVREAFTDIFPPITSQRLFELTEGLRTFTEGLKIGAEPAEKLKRSFKGLFSVFSIGLQAVKAIGKAFGDLVAYALPAGNSLLGFTAIIGDWLVKLDEAVKAGDIFSASFEKIGNVIRPIADGAKEAFSIIIDVIKSFATANLAGIDAVGARLKERLAPFSVLGEGVAKGIDAVGAVLKRAISFFASIGVKVGNTISGISESFTGFNFNSAIDLLNAGLTGGIAIAIKKFIDSLTKITGDAEGFLKSIQGILDGVRGALTAWQTSLKADTLIKISAAIAVLVGALTVLSLIDSDKLLGALGAITVLFAELFVSMIAFEKIVDGPGFIAMAKITGSMIGLSTAVLILSSALSNLAKLDWDGLVRGLVGIAGLSGILVVSAKSLSTSSTRLLKGSTGLIVFAASIRILVGAVEDLGALDTGDLTRGLVGVGVLCAELALFLKVSDLDGMSLGKSGGFIALAAAVRILATAVGIFGGLDPDALVRGLLAVGAVLAELAIFTKATGNASKVVSTATGMILLGAAINIFAVAIERMGAMSLSGIAKGLLGMGGALTAVTLALNFMPKNMIAMGVGLIGVATAITILSSALVSLGGMSWEQVAVGLVALAGSMTVLAIATNAMTGALPGAAAIFVVSAAIAMLTPALKSLGEMTWGDAVKSLLILAGTFGVLGLAAFALAPLTPALLALAGAIALFGVASLAVGAGVLLFATGLSALAVAGTGAAAALVLVVSSLIGLIPMLIQQVGQGIILLIQVIGDAAPELVGAISAILVSLLDAIVAVGPKLVTTVVELLILLLETIVKHTPRIVQSGANLLLALLRGIRDNIGEIVEVGVEAILAFLQGIVSQIPVIVTAAFEMIISFIDGLGEAIAQETPRLLAAIQRLAVNIVKGLAGGIISGAKEVGNAVIDLGKTALNGLKDFLGIRSPSKVFQSIGQFTSQGFIGGIRDKFGDARVTAENLGGTVLHAIQNFLGIASPSKVMRDEVGRYIVMGIAEGITKDMSAEEAAEKKAQNIVSAFKAELDRLDLASTTTDLEYSLWGKLSGMTASGPEKAAMQLQVLTKKFMTQTEKVKLAQAEYQTTVDTLGKDSDQAQQAYNKYLQTQIDLADAAEEMTAAQKNQSKAIRNSEQAYYAELQENTEFLKSMGFSMEEIEKNARERTGYNPKALTDGMSLDVKDAVTSAMGTVETVYQDQAKSSFSSLMTNFKELEGSYSKSISDGVKDGSTKLVENTKAIMKTSLDLILAEKKNWAAAGSALVNAFIEGIRSNVERAAKEAASMAYAAYKAAMDAIEQRTAEEEAMTDGLTEAKNRIDTLLNDDNFQPTIKPVLDLTNVADGVKRVGSFFKSNAVAIKTVTDKVRETAGTFANSATKVSSQKETGGTSIVFQQTNNSPKPLSRIDIYRQTQNQIATLKEVVTKV